MLFYRINRAKWLHHFLLVNFSAFFLQDLPPSLLPLLQDADELSVRLHCQRNFSKENFAEILDLISARALAFNLSGGLFGALAVACGFGVSKADIREKRKVLARIQRLTVTKEKALAIRDTTHSMPQISP